MMLKRIGPLLPLVGFLIVFFALPVMMLLATSMQAPDGTLSLVNYSKLFGSELYVRVLWSTIKISTSVACIACAAAYPVAYLIAISRGGLQKGLMLLVLLP